MKVLIVGAGAMGNWFAHVAENVELLVFADTNPEAALGAAETHDGQVLDTAAGESFDLVCVAVPMTAVAEAIQEYAPLAERAMIDLTGQMAEPVSLMAEAAPAVERMSLHPLFAPENAPGSVAAVVDNPGPVSEEVQRWLRVAGCRIVETSVEEHDRAMRTIQVKAHAALLAYALAAEPVPDGFETPISAGLVDLLDDFLAGSPGVYADIQDQFAGADDIAAAATEIAGADHAEFERLYREAQRRLQREHGH